MTWTNFIVKIIFLFLYSICCFCIYACFFFMSIYIELLSAVLYIIAYNMCELCILFTFIFIHPYAQFMIFLGFIFYSFLHSLTLNYPSLFWLRAVYVAFICIEDKRNWDICMYKTIHSSI